MDQSTWTPFWNWMRPMANYWTHGVLHYSISRMVWPSTMTASSGSPMWLYIKCLSSSQNPDFHWLRSDVVSSRTRFRAVYNPARFHYVNQQLCPLQVAAKYVTIPIFSSWLNTNRLLARKFDWLFLSLPLKIFVADGYCNNRILKFDAAGRFLRVIPQPPEFLSLLVPHGLTLLEDLDLICVADRENMRVVCPRWE